jgi:hypothetical protein
MKKLIEFDEKCRACGGTGLYAGRGEAAGAAIVCYVCKGTGRHRFRHEYEEFTGRLKRPGVTRVYETNPGIRVGEGKGFRLEDFGGLPLEDWEAGLPFGPGTENRRFTCPCWWYQTADYKLKPAWSECGTLGSFSQCPYFGRKSECWERWDREFGGAADKKVTEAPRGAPV